MDYSNIGGNLIARAKKYGATDAEVYIEEENRFSADIIKDKIEHIIESSNVGLGLRIFLEGGTSLVHTTDFSDDSLRNLVNDGISFAKASGKDESVELEPPSLIKDEGNLNIFDVESVNLKPDVGIKLAKETSESAYSSAKFKIETVSVNFEASSRKIHLLNSRGFQKSFPQTENLLTCCVVSRSNGEKHRGCFHSGQRFLDKLPSPEYAGGKAIHNAERIMGARKLESKKMPVILENEAASFLWGKIFQALRGDEVFYGRSFLADRAGKQVASPLVTLHDNGKFKGGIGTVPWDAEGVSSTDKIMIDKGILTGFFYDTVYAKKTGKSPTGNTMRSYNTLPGLVPTNLYLDKGATSLEEMTASLKEGFFVTSLIGLGVDHVTGTFSQGAEGIYIRNGEFAFPVEEVVISGNMLDMMKNIEKVGDDLEFHSSISSSSVLINEMMVGGK